MLSRQRLLDLASAPDTHRLCELLVAAAHELGFGLVAAVLVRGPMDSGWRRTIDNTPAAWIEQQYSIDATMRDPVVAHCLQSPAPVTYDQSTYVRAGAAELWDAQAPHGFVSGVACALHETSHWETFILGVDGPSLPADAVDRLRAIASVQLLAVHAQAAMQRLFTPAADRPVLTSTEADTLRWAAGGRSVARIGDLLAITEHDVVRAQRSGARKLGARSVSTAALRLIDQL